MPCLLCGGRGVLLAEACPLCDGVIGWPEQELGYVMSEESQATFARGSMPAEGLSILSWNIFNPDTIGVADKSNPHYEHLTDGERFWEHRWPKILDEIRIADATVVCLQEIKKELYDEMRDSLAAFGYEAVTHARKKMQRNSLAVFFKRVKKIWEKNVRIKGFEKTLAIGLDDGGRTLAVVTCHLEGHPEKASDRIGQLATTFEEIKDLPHDAIVIAGDFNAPLVEQGRSSAVSCYMRQGTVLSGTREWGHEVVVDPSTLRNHGYDLVSVYSPGPAFSISLHGEGPAFIDQIWCSQSLEVVGIRDVFFTGDFCAAALSQGLPNLQNPSDHLPLGVVLRWR